MKLQELIENNNISENSSMADKALGGATKVAGAIDKVGKFASAVTGVKSGQQPGLLSGINTAQLRNTLYKVINKQELTQQDIDLLNQTYKSL